jgi:hypothetical protein
MWMGDLPVCIINNNKIGSGAFKHFYPLIVANSSVHSWQPIVSGSLPLSFYQAP